ncbi:hypothetical protein Calni_1693 [Calditerrivibrio nitroreducens DSM 19672]|uniref:Uncharacterized protein n=2 Tax=Calditerrivibrio nitroreducens TaxID=477976 RepID=E4TFU3_CALNY|nr:hypothetical protein Calni_1693 [Calditerrivibrio nitroreducens DSM 19672]
MVQARSITSKSNNPRVGDPPFFMALLRIGTIIYLLITMAHYLRYGNMVFVLIFALLGLAIFFRNKYFSFIITFFLFVGLVEWLKTFYGIFIYRMMYHLPYLRLSVIFLAVLFLNIWLIYKYIRQIWKSNNGGTGINQFYE